MKDSGILAIAPLPPTRTGIAIYSLKFYAQLSKLTKIKLLTLSKVEGHEISYPFETITAKNFVSLLTRTFKSVASKENKVISYQFGLTTFINPLITIIYTLLLILLSKIHKKCLAITLHTVPTHKAIKATLKKFGALSSVIFGAYKVVIKMMINSAEITIVHSEFIKMHLEKHYKPKSKISVIPHGTRIYECGAKQGDDVKILLHGFLRKSKGIETLLVVTKKLKEDGLKIRVIVAGPEHKGEKTVKWIEERVSKLGLKDQVQLIPRYLNFNELKKLICESTLIVLPYKDHFIEASGVLSELLSSGKPIICTKIPKFLIDLDTAKYLHFVEPDNKDELELEIKKILNDYENSELMAKRLKRIAEKRSWHNVAKKYHKEIKSNCHFLP